MDPKTTVLLVKIVALFDSPNDGERDNAFTKARELLEKHGQGGANVSEVLTTLGVRASAIADFMDWVQDGHAATTATDRAVPGKFNRHPGSEHLQDQAESSAEIIARYGSIEAALQPCKWETLLRNGDLTFRAPPNERWTRSVCGYMPEQPDGPARDRAMQAMARAFPLPSNMQDAQAENAHWARRDRELQLVQGHSGNTSGLDLTARLRHAAVRSLIRSELPVHGKADLQLRLQFWIDEHQDEIHRTSRDDVMRLAEMVGRDLGSAIVRNSNATTVLFAQWVCDVVVPALQLPDRARASSNLKFDGMLRDAMRAALTEIEPQRPG